MNATKKYLLEALLAGKTIQLGKELTPSSIEWIDAKDGDQALAWIASTDTSSRLRAKPKSITLGGIEFPEPMQVAPADGTIYWLVIPAGFSAHRRWCGSNGELRALRRGLIQSTCEGARMQQEAMIKSIGGKL